MMAPEDRIFQKALQKKGKTAEEITALLAEKMPDLAAEIEEDRRVNKYLKDFITSDPDMLKVKDEVRLLAEVDDPVLILGETGTGKELLANALHGDRPEDKFVAINCAGLPEALIESELFGHVKGAFTGATSDKTGLLQSAYGGTIFLDEIAELSAHLQAKLLRAIQEQRIRKVGADLEKGEGEIKINCRIIGATHKDLDEFREDFLYRVGMFKLEIKALRYRTQDIPGIVKRIIIKGRGKINHEIEDIDKFCRPIMENKDKLHGNVRQLQAIVRNYQVLGRIPKF